MAAAIKRFYKTVSVTENADGFGVALDGKRVKSTAGAPLRVSSRKLADAIAAEWRAQGETIDRTTMPLNAIAMAGGAGEIVTAQWREDISKYLGTDLICYRAEAPSELVARQAQAWDAFIDWFETKFGVRLTVAAGIVAVAQSPALSAAILSELARLDGASLFALRSLTAITGSAVLALALWRGDFAGDEVFEASRIDERFQQEKWGVDTEAAAREAAIKSEFDALAQFLNLSRKD